MNRQTVSRLAPAAELCVISTAIVGLVWMRRYFFVLSRTSAMRPRLTVQAVAFEKRCGQTNSRCHQELCPLIPTNMHHSGSAVHIQRSRCRVLRRDIELN